MRALLDRIRAYANLVTISHSVFALPFALMMVVVVSREYPVTWGQFLLLLVCVISARSAAMAFNRLVDAHYDAENIRTSQREIPAGVVSTREAVSIVVIASTIFIGAAMLLGAHCGVLAPPVLAVLLGYSLLKRFTSICHFFLGLSLACAPGGVWYALTATFSWQPIPLMATVLLWVTGFDILYACQDIEFDRSHNLQSIPSRLGIRGAQRLSALVHFLSVLLLAVFGLSNQLGAVFWCGTTVFSVLVASQHLAVRRRGIGCINKVFFTRNGIASVVLFMCTLLDCR